MMDDEYKKYTVDLTEMLIKTSQNFALEKLGEKELNCSPMINLILSAHLSSCFSIMERIAEDGEKLMKVKVSAFKEEIFSHILKILPGSKVE